MTPDVLSQSIPSERRLSITTEHENRLGIADASSSEVPEITAVPQLVAARAQESPDALALVYERENLTYSELNQLANQLARYLQELGVAPGVFAGIYLPRSWQFVVGALAVMKAGGAYLPLDPAYPPERLSYMLQNAQVPVLITAAELAASTPRGSWRVVDLDADQSRITGFSDEPPLCIPAASDPAYLIYTSGSSGRPKGVSINQGNLLNLIAWHTEAFSVGSGDRAGQVAGLGFDACVWELWPHLAAGASIHIADELTRKSPARLQEWLVAEQITISFVPTALAETLIAMEWPPSSALGRLLTGGDVLRNYPRAGLPFAVYNNYGPAECTVVATSGVVQAESNSVGLPSIGAPITNARIYILDENRQALPAGSAGEIYVGGAGTSDGYLNQPELSAEKFIPNPFGDADAPRLYRTGDLARWRDDGQIDFLGRVDNQVKIRGQRLEPDEIAAWLNRHPAVASSVVVARDAGEEKRLVAYLVMRNGDEPGRGDLQKFLSQNLPPYMVPATFVQLEQLPLTANGKIDRPMLPPPTEANTIGDKQSVAPQTAVERQLEQIVASLLRLKKVGRDDNFFLLGGHSLLGTQVITKARATFGVEVSLRTIFEFPTIAGLAGEIERLRQNPSPTPSRCIHEH
jgi:amino acid adenylation domain-containing protein